MPITSGNFARLLEPGLREIFFSGASRPQPMRDTLFRMVNSTRSKEEYQDMGASGLVPVWNGTVPYDDTHGGYMTAIRNYELAQGIAVERNLVDDAQGFTINGRALGLGEAFANTQEHDAVQVFINGFTDSGTNRLGASTNGADGVGLLSTAHPYRPDATGSTQANEGTLALTLANLDTTRQAVMNWVDDKGQLMGVMPDTLLVPAELERAATQILSERAVFEPGSAQFDVNMFSGKMRLLVWNRLTDANAWFVIDSARMKRFLIWQRRIDPEFAQTEDFDGMIAKFRGYMRYGIGWTHWSWIYGQNPS